MNGYFQHYRAWRRAFLDLLDLEQPEEIRSRGVETEHGPYQSYEEKEAAIKARIRLVGGTGISSNSRQRET